MGGVVSGIVTGEVQGLSQNNASKQTQWMVSTRSRLWGQADTTLSEKELWDQGVQVTLLIHEEAIVLHTCSTIACECPKWNKRESRS